MRVDHSDFSRSGGGEGCGRRRGEEETTKNNVLLVLHLPPPTSRLTQTETLLTVLAKHHLAPFPAKHRSCKTRAATEKESPSALPAMLMILLTSIKFGFPTAKIFVKCRSISKIVDSSRGREMSICPFELENRFNT